MLRNMFDIIHFFLCTSRWHGNLRQGRNTSATALQRKCIWMDSGDDELISWLPFTSQYVLMCPTKGRFYISLTGLTFKFFFLWKDVNTLHLCRNTTRLPSLKCLSASVSLNSNIFWQQCMVLFLIATISLVKRCCRLYSSYLRCAVVIFLLIKKVHFFHFRFTHLICSPGSPMLI